MCVRAAPSRAVRGCTAAVAVAVPVGEGKEVALESEERPVSVLPTVAAVPRTKVKVRVEVK